MYRPKSKKKKKNNQRPLLKIIIGLLVILFVLIGLAAVPVLLFRKPVLAAKTHAQAAKTAWDERRLDNVQSELIALEQSRHDIERVYSWFGLIRYIPVINKYYTEGSHLLIVGQHGLETARVLVAGIEPYAEPLGLTPEAEETSVEVKMEQFVQLIPQLVPVIDQTREPVQQLIPAIDALDPSLYPESIRGKAVRERVEHLQSFLPLAELLLDDTKPLINNFASALGEPDPADYLVLFMNDKERRPIMGFITAFTTVHFDGGHFEVGASRDIYEISDEESLLPLPAPLVTYLKAGGFHLRDVNFSPDYQQSVDDFLYYWERMGQPPVDGVIALDTAFLQNLIGVTGPIDLPEYQINYSLFQGIPESCLAGGTAFDVENVVCRLELISEKNIVPQEQRKAVLGKLMDAIVEWVLHAPQEEWDTLLLAVRDSLIEKHLLVSLQNEELQRVMERYNLSGRLYPITDLQPWMFQLNCEKDGASCREEYEVVQAHDYDYVHINDANLAGLKSDFFIERSVTMADRTDEQGDMVRRLSITYHNTGRNDGWLNAVGRNYVRVYVPRGAELVAWEGGDQWNGVHTFDELNKTVFDNFVLIPPLEQRTLVFEYRLPRGVDTTTLMIQKQPGLEKAGYEVVDSEGNRYTFNLDKDIVLNIDRRS